MGVAPANAATITFDKQTVLPGQQIFIDVYGVNLEDVFAFGFNPGFNPTIISFNRAIEGTFLSSTGLPTSFDYCPNTGCEDDPVSILSAVAGDGAVSSRVPDVRELLATLVFTAIAPGDAVFELNARLLNSNFEDIAFETDFGTISTVPEPSTLALLGVGLAAMARKRLKKKTTA
jgi:hypothetical protein